MVTLKEKSYKKLVAKIQEIEPTSSYEVINIPNIDSKTIDKLSKNLKLHRISSNSLVKIKASVEVNIEEKKAYFLNVGVYNKNLIYKIDMFNECSEKEYFDMLYIGKNNLAKPYKLNPIYKQEKGEDLQDNIYEEEFEKDELQPSKQEPILEDKKNFSEEKEPEPQIKQQLKESEVQDDSIISPHDTEKPIKLKEIIELGVIRLKPKEMLEIINNNKVQNDITYLVEFDKNYEKALYNHPVKNMFYISN